MKNRSELHAYLYCNLISTEQPLPQLISIFIRNKDAKWYDPFLKQAQKQLETISFHRKSHLKWQARRHDVCVGSNTHINLKPFSIQGEERCGQRGEKKGRKWAEREDTCFHVSVDTSFVIASTPFSFVRSIPHGWSRQATVLRDRSSTIFSLETRRPSLTTKESAHYNFQHQSSYQYLQSAVTNSCLWHLSKPCPRTGLPKHYWYAFRVTAQYSWDPLLLTPLLLLTQVDCMVDNERKGTMPAQNP